MSMYIRECVFNECSKEFLTNKSIQKYCSKDCKLSYEKKVSICKKENIKIDEFKLFKERLTQFKTCEREGCNNKFKIFTTKKYCSEECRKIVVNKQNREFRERHHERLLEEGKEYRKNNFDRIKDNKRRYIKNNFDRIKELNEKNHDKIRIQNRKSSKKYRENNPEKRKKIVNNYIKNNPDKIKENRHNRRAIGKVPSNFEKEQMIKQNYMCGNLIFCKTNLKKLSSKDITIEHFIPVSRNGTNDPENLRVWCKECNSSKNNKTIEEYYFWKLDNL